METYGFYQSKADANSWFHPNLGGGICFDRNTYYYTAVTSRLENGLYHEYERTHGPFETFAAAAEFALRDIPPS